MSVTVLRHGNNFSGYECPECKDVDNVYMETQQYISHTSNLEHMMIQKTFVCHSCGCKFVVEEGTN